MPKTLRRACLAASLLIPLISLASCFFVNAPVTLDRDTLSVAIGEIKAIVFSPAGAAVTWTSDNTAVATVSSNGRVTGVALGTATITATGGGSTDTCLVTVSNPVAVTGVIVDATAQTSPAYTVALTAAVVPANATFPTVTWSSLNPGIATVDSKGIVTGVDVGTTSIVVTTTEGGFTDTCTVDVVTPGEIVIIAE